GDKADVGPEPVVVLSDATNQKLFGGANSVGRTIRLEEREFTVVGVTAPWRPIPKYFDTHNGSTSDTEEIYIPILWAEPMEIVSAGNTSGWKRYEGREFSDFLASENVWLQMWVELKDEQAVEEYRAFLDAYALEQKKAGRFQRPINNRLLTVSQWLQEEEVVPEEARAMLIIGLLFLLVCSVNLIGILLSKFLARAPEVSVRRALGASRLTVFLQHVTECEIVGVIGGLIGIGLTFVGVRLVENLFDTTFSFTVDLNMMAVAVALSLASALVAGLYPAWRICRIQPAQHLKIQ
ncbi:MAG TPA: FtsX-like permease family protein, partial [Candidatus Polarisedimenticolia bacterium]|nr:FtsX-like permease family protein [Candidatus Polarisedimenticolia bacterium]